MDASLVADRVLPVQSFIVELGGYIWLAEAAVFFVFERDHRPSFSTASTNVEPMMSRAYLTAASLVAAIAVMLISVFTIPALRPQFDAEREEWAPFGQLLVIGLSGVEWDFLSPDRTPHLWEFAGDSATANLVVQTIGATTSPGNGWLTLNAGREADGVRTGEFGQANIEVDGSTVVGWDEIIESDDAYAVVSPERAVDGPGMLGDRLAEFNLGAIGPGGALAITDSEGVVQGRYFDAAPSEAASTYENMGLASADAVFVDLGSIAPKDTEVQEISSLRAAFSPPLVVSSEALDNLTKADAEFGALLAAAPSDARIMLMSPADLGADSARLRIFAASQPGGAVASTWSTRKPGLVQLTDVSPTILEMLGADSSGLMGSEIWPQRSGEGVAARVAALVDAEQRGAFTRSSVAPFYLLWIGAALVGLAVTGKHWWSSGVGKKGQAESSGVRPRFETGAHTVGLEMSQFLLASAALPVSSMLVQAVPWWRVPAVPTFVFLALCVGLACLIGALANLGRRLGRGVPSASVAALTAGVLALDAMLGSYLHSPSVLGDQPQSGGRFYGLSNAPFVLFGVAMIFLAAFAVRVCVQVKVPWLAVPAVMGIGVAAMVVDGSSAIGADFGGVPALIVSFAIFILLVLNRELRPRTFMWILLAAGVGTLFASFLDWLRPVDSRTHLGNFFQSIVDGNAHVAVIRKIGLLAGSVPWWAWVFVAMFVAGLTWYGMRARRNNWQFEIHELGAYGQGALAVASLGLVGLAVNDSGLVLPLVAIIFGGPLWAVLVRDSR